MLFGVFLMRSSENMVRTRDRRPERECKRASPNTGETGKIISVMNSYMKSLSAPEDKAIKREETPYKKEELDKKERAMITVDAPKIKIRSMIVLE